MEVDTRVVPLEALSVKEVDIEVDVKEVDTRFDTEVEAEVVELEVE